jgi:hypothetical protein
MQKVYDTAPRNHPATPKEPEIIYTNNTGRNDFHRLKVARDNKHVFFFKMKRLAPHPYWNSKFDAEPLDFDIETGDESAPAHVYVLTWTDKVNPQDLTVKINGTEAKFKKATADGLFVFEIDPSAVKVGMSRLSVDCAGKAVKAGNDDRRLKDAALFFCRDTNDVEMRKLIAICAVNH